MPPGPILIFDKSALQAVSLDESNWLDNFFLTNIVPLFLAETLADLEKEVHSGRTPEQIVGGLSLRTPDMQAYPCAHHRKLIGGSLYGHDVPMDGRIPCDAGKVVNLDSLRGVFFEKTPEEEALQRWYRGEFLDLERQTAKKQKKDSSATDGLPFDCSQGRQNDARAVSVPRMTRVGSHSRCTNHRSPITRHTNFCRPSRSRLDRDANIAKGLRYKGARNSAILVSLC